jgi:hypothetical protein
LLCDLKLDRPTSLLLDVLGAAHYFPSKRRLVAA